MNCRSFGLGGVDALRNPTIKPRLGLSYHYPAHVAAERSIVRAPNATNSANVPKHNVTIERAARLSLESSIGDIQESTKSDEAQVMGGNNTLIHGDHGQRK